MKFFYPKLKELAEKINAQKEISKEKVLVNLTRPTDS
jgi:hypothetical protein